MRLTSLCAITLALSLCGTAAAQVGTLVVHDTANDPCQKFKMRVLMPADVGTTPRSESPVGSPDPGIVWNPCREDAIQLAAAPILVTPGQGTLPALPSFKQQPPAPRIEQSNFPGVQLPPAFEMMRRHR
ncbi:MAG: hypothetical protein JOZ02_14645 [Acidobacteria bacterium]|nr:hypothetical protein [Acidobacteriota bacterium]